MHRKAPPLVNSRPKSHQAVRREVTWSESLDWTAFLLLWRSSSWCSQPRRSSAASRLLDESVDVRQVAYTGPIAYCGQTVASERGWSEALGTSLLKALAATNREVPAALGLKCMRTIGSLFANEHRPFKSTHARYETVAQNADDPAKRLRTNVCE